MRKVLIADDEPYVLRLLGTALGRAGFDVRTVPDGEAALAAVHHQQPDVLITDSQMPRMGGQALCEAIEDEFPVRNFLICVMSAQLAPGDHHWVRSLQNALFIEKPISAHRLVGALEEYFERPEVANAG